MYAKVCLLVDVLLLVAGGCAQNRAAAQPTPDRCVASAPRSSALIYYDGTPGARFWLKTDEMVAEKEPWRAGQVRVVVTTSRDFVSRLRERTWDRVMVFAKWTPEEPPYAGALRKYAMAHPDPGIDIRLWHDFGRRLDPQVATVSAPTALVTWHYGRSTIGYALTSGPAAQAQTKDGLVFPDFKGVKPAFPEFLILPPDWPNESTTSQSATIPSSAPRGPSASGRSGERCNRMGPGGIRTPGEY
jgi:hypothetical protein